MLKGTNSDKIGSSYLISMGAGSLLILRILEMMLLLIAVIQIVKASNKIDLNFDHIFIVYAKHAHSYHRRRTD